MDIKGDRDVRDSTFEQSQQLKKQQREIIEAEERRLAETKAHYDKKIQEANASGEAAVNHIKSKNQKEIDHLTQQLESLRKRNQVLSEEEAKNQNSKIQKIHKTYSQELNQTSNKFNQEVEELKTENRLKTQKEMENNKKMSEAMKAEHQSRLERESLLREEQLRNSRKTTQETISEDQKIKNETLRQMKSKYETTLAKEKQSQRDELQKTSQEHSEILEKRRARFSEDSDQEQSQYANHINKIHKEGDKKIYEEQERARNVQLKQQTLNKKEMEELNQRHQERVANQQLSSEKELERQNVIFQKELARQEEEFKEQFNLNASRFHEAYENQNKNFERALQSKRLEMMEKFKKYSGTENDPFYKMKHAGTSFFEHPNAYVVETEIPKHEYKNVNIMVQKDKVILSGARAFEDQITEAGRTITTNKRETFREEFPIDKAIRDKEIQKYYSNGILKVIIPKVT